MKLLALLALGLPSLGAITVVHPSSPSDPTSCSDASGSNISSLSCPAINMTTGNTVAVDVCFWESTTHDGAWAVTDTANNTYVAQGSGHLDASNVRCVWFVASNITGNPANIVKVTFTIRFQVKPAMQVVEISGLAPSSVDLDVSASGSSSTTYTSAAFSTSQASEIILGVGYSSNAPGRTYTAGTIGGTGATLAQTDPSGWSGLEYVTVASVLSSATATEMVNSSAPSWQMDVLSLKGPAVTSRPHHRRGVF